MKDSRVICLTVLVVLTALVAGAGTGCSGQTSAPPVPDRPIRLMAKGDSTTEGSSNNRNRGSWRDDFHRMMRDAGYTNGTTPGFHYDMVGTHRSVKPHDIEPFDADCQAWGSHSIQNLHDRAIRGVYPEGTDGGDADWSGFAPPDAVLLLVGALDVSRLNAGSDNRTAASLDESIDDLKELLAGLRERNPRVTILLSTPLPSSAANRLGPVCSMEDLKDRIVATCEAGGFDAPGSPVLLVDQWTGFDPATMTGDGTHPNPAGQAFIARNYLNALRRSGVLKP